MSHIDAALAACLRFENKINTMYLDTTGHVTVGVGMMLPSTDQAVLLPFMVGKREATAAEIAADFDRVKAMPLGWVARHYALPSSPTLPDEAIMLECKATLCQFDADLLKLLPCYALLPESWRAALLEMAFNLGPHGLVKDFPHLMQAVEAGNWQACMALCRRPQLSMALNDWTKDQFDPSVAAFPPTAPVISAAQ